MGKKDAMAYRRAAKSCYVGFSSGVYAGYALFYLGEACDYDHRYHNVKQVFAGMDLEGEEAVLALCFAAAMAEAGDL